MNSTVLYATAIDVFRKLHEGAEPQNILVISTHAYGLPAILSGTAATHVVFFAFRPDVLRLARERISTVRKTRGAAFSERVTAKTGNLARFLFTRKPSSFDAVVLDLPSDLTALAGAEIYAQIWLLLTPLGVLEIRHDLPDEADRKRIMGSIAPAFGSEFAYYEALPNGETLVFAIRKEE